MSNLFKVARLAKILRWITITAMVLLPFAIALSLSLYPLTPETMNTDVTVSPNATSVQMMAAFIIGLLGPLVFLLTMNEMRKLFAAYGNGEILTDRCARLIQRIGQGFLALAIVNFLLHPVQRVLLTMANPPGQRQLAISLTSEMVFFALCGGLIIVIGWAMREASAVASENRSFV